MKMLLVTLDAETWCKILLGNPFLWICYIVLGLCAWAEWSNRKERNKHIKDFDPWKRVPLWEKQEYYNKDGILVQVWKNRTNGKQIKSYYANNVKREQETTWQWKIYRYEERERERKIEKERQNALNKKRRLKSEHIYFEEHASFGNYIISIHVPEILTNPNPMIPLWAKGTNTSVRQGGHIVSDELWFNLKGEYKFKEAYRRKYQREGTYSYHKWDIDNKMTEGYPIKYGTAFKYDRDGIIDLNAKIPLSEVKLTRIPNDQIHSSEFDDDYGKYNHQGQKVPSWIWTVFPSMTGIFLIFGLIALPMEGGILFGIGLFILWCVGMYKNAEYKDRINK